MPAFSQIERTEDQRIDRPMDKHDARLRVASRISQISVSMIAGVSLLFAIFRCEFPIFKINETTDKLKDSLSSEFQGELYDDFSTS